MSGAQRGIWVDGYRPADGAVIVAKNVRNQRFRNHRCGPRSLQGLQHGSDAATRR